MRLIFTEQAISSLNDATTFLIQNLSAKQVNSIIDTILDRCDDLLINPQIGKRTLP